MAKIDSYKTIGAHYSADGIRAEFSAHMKLVKRVASHFRGRLPAAIEFSDLVQAGSVGLIEALNAFDSEKGTDFETFAKLRIRGAMLDEIRRSSWAPRSTVKLAVQARGVAEKIAEETGTAPTHRQVAAALGMDLHKFQELRGRNQGLASSVAVEEVEFESEELGPLELVEREDLIKLLKERIALLSERDRLILALYYDEELTLKEIGAVLEVSESRVSQILSALAKKLSSVLHEEAPRTLQDIRKPINESRGKQCL